MVIPSKQPHNLNIMRKPSCSSGSLYRSGEAYNAKSRIHWKIIFAKIKIINVSKKIKSC